VVEPLGRPVSIGLIAEFGTFLAAFQTMPLITAICIFGIVLSAGYMLWTVRRVFFGPLRPAYLTLGDAHGVELVPLFTLMALIIFFGVFPSVLTDVVESGVIPIVARLGTQ